MLVLLLSIVLLAGGWGGYYLFQKSASIEEIPGKTENKDWDLTVSENELLHFTETELRDQNYELYTAYHRMIALMHSSMLQQMEYASPAVGSLSRGKDLRLLLKAILCKTIDNTNSLTNLEGFVQKIEQQNNLIQVCNYLRILSENNLLEELLKEANLPEYQQVKSVLDRLQHTIEEIGLGSGETLESLQASRKIVNDLSA